MIGRVAILLAVTGGVLMAGILLRHYARRQRNTVLETVRLRENGNGQPRIVSFYGPSCDACDRQKTVLSELVSERSGQLAVELHDATVDYDYGRQFGLVMVPTTVVIRPDGVLAGINSGFTARTVLEAQLDAA